jgi:hypothetical protein
MTEFDPERSLTVHRGITPERTLIVLPGGIPLGRKICELTAEEVLSLLKPEPNQTCGFVRVTFTSKQSISTHRSSR